MISCAVHLGESLRIAERSCAHSGWTDPHSDSGLAAQLQFLRWDARLIETTLDASGGAHARG